MALMALWIFAFVCWRARKQPLCVCVSAELLWEPPALPTRPSQYVPARCHSQDGWQLNRIKGTSCSTLQPMCWIHNEAWIYSPHLCVWISIFNPILPRRAHAYSCACRHIQLSMNDTRSKSLVIPRGNIWVVSMALRGAGEDFLPHPPLFFFFKEGRKTLVACCGCGRIECAAGNRWNRRRQKTWTNEQPCSCHWHSRYWSAFPQQLRGSQ